MADFLFILFVVYCIYVFCRDSYRHDKYGYVSTRDINKFHSESVALQNKHRSKVLPYDDNGNLNTTVKQFINQEGVYSKEFHEEYKELTKKYFGIR